MSTNARYQMAKHFHQKRSLLSSLYLKTLSDSSAHEAISKSLPCISDLSESDTAIWPHKSFFKSLCNPFDAGAGLLCVIACWNDLFFTQLNNNQAREQTFTVEDNQSLRLICNSVFVAERNWDSDTSYWSYLLSSPLKITLFGPIN